MKITHNVISDYRFHYFAHNTRTGRAIDDKSTGYTVADSFHYLTPRIGNFTDN